MQKILAIVLVSLMATALVAQAAAKREEPKGPSPAQIEKANDKATFAPEDTAVHKVPTGSVKFIPAKIGDFNEAQIAKGVILGKLESPHKTVDGLPIGTYHAYVCKEGGEWVVYYCKGTDVVGKAKSIEKVDHTFHKPEFNENGHAIFYWVLKFSW